MPWTAHALRLLPVRHFVGIARFLSIPTCTFSVTKIGTVGKSCARSELVHDDGRRKCACHVPGRRRWLCSCRWSAGTACWEWQSKTNSWWHDIPPLSQGVSITLAKMRGKWAFTIPPFLTAAVVHWFWPVICWHHRLLPCQWLWTFQFCSHEFFSCVYFRPFLSNLRHEHKHYVVDLGAYRIVFEHK